MNDVNPFRKYDGVLMSLTFERYHNLLLAGYIS
ncbi:unnamed protein product, partial [Callosobruchus maculatus]